MAVSAVPDRLSSVTPSLVVTPCAEAIDWYVKVFGATEHGPRMTGPDGLVGHAELTIAGSVIMLGDEWDGFPVRSPRTLGGTTGGLFIYSDDAATIWARAVEHGAEVVAPFELQFYGDESGRIKDPFGHSWGIGRHVEDVSQEEMDARMAKLYGGEA